jgi:Na+/phosphate symporter
MRNKNLYTGKIALRTNGKIFHSEPHKILGAYEENKKVYIKLDNGDDILSDYITIFENADEAKEFYNSTFKKKEERRIEDVSEEKRVVEKPERRVRRAKVQRGRKRKKKAI